MCGIFGGVGVDESRAIACLNEILRGDDGISVERYGEVVLGSRRHMVKKSNKTGIPRGASDQPYETENEAISLVFNGELYNFSEVKEQLQKLGREFDTDGDTEVLLRLYEQFGSGFFAKPELDALFAVAIFDRDRNALMIARDWPGRVPLFYFWDKPTRRFVFSSELKGFGPLDDVSLADPIELKPGTIATLDLETFELDIQTYFKPTPKKTKLPLSEVGRELHQVLLASGRNRTMGDVPICTMLSGGIDSVMSSYYVFQGIDYERVDFRPVSYVYQIDDYESEDVRRACEAAKGFQEIGLELKVVKSSGDQLVEDIPHIIELFEMRKIRALSVYPLPIYYYLAPAMREDGFKVTVGGHGVDELIGAYDSWKELDKSHEVQVDVRSRLAFINAIYENMMRRASIIFMNRGPIEARFPFLCPAVCEYMLGIDAKWLSLSPENANQFLELVSRFAPHKSAHSEQLKSIMNQLSDYLDNGGIHPPDSPPEDVSELEKLFWKLPLIVAGMHASADSWLDINVLFNAKLRGQHGSGITSLESKIVERYSNLGTSDAAIFEAIAAEKFGTKLPTSDLRTS